MKILYIDTTSDEIKLALLLDDEIILKTQVSSMKHSIYTMNLLTTLLEENNVSIKDIEKIMVCNGPGSFTGIRIGIVIAKTIAYCLNIPITSVSYLEMLGFNHKECLTLRLDKDDIYYYTFMKDNRVLSSGLASLDTIKSDVLFNNQTAIVTTIDEQTLKRALAIAKQKESVCPHLVNPIYLKDTKAESSLI